MAMFYMFCRPESNFIMLMPLEKGRIHRPDFTENIRVFAGSLFDRVHAIRPCHSVWLKLVHITPRRLLKIYIVFNAL
jgi:hypothetical protein